MVSNVRISLSFLGVGLFFAASFISLLGFVRMGDKDLSFSERFRMSLDGGVKANQQRESILPQTKELAGSINTIHASVSYIERTEDFGFGIFQVNQLVTAIPFLGAGLVAELQQDKQIKKNSTPEFITWIIQGRDPIYGNGSSSIADLYLDFGVVGVFLGMILFGFLIRYIEVAMFSNDRLPILILHVLAAIYFANAIYIARATVLGVIQLAVWIWVILIINRMVNGWKGRKVKMYG